MKSQEHYQPEIVPPAEKEPEGLDLLVPVYPVSANFTSVTVQKPDGALFTAEVDRKVDVIDAGADDK